MSLCVLRPTDISDDANHDPQSDHYVYSNYRDTPRGHLIVNVHSGHRPIELGGAGDGVQGVFDGVRRACTPVAVSVEV